MTEVAEKRGGIKGKSPAFGVGFFSGASDSWIRENLNVWIFTRLVILTSPQTGARHFTP